MKLTKKDVQELELSVLTNRTKVIIGGILWHIPPIPKSISGAKEREKYSAGLVGKWVRELGVVVV